MRFLRTPFKPLRRLNFGGFAGFEGVTKRETLNQHVAGSIPAAPTNQTATFKAFVKRKNKFQVAYR